MEAPAKPGLSALLRSLLDQPFPTLGRLQEGRGLWLAGAFFALGMELFSVLYYQKHLGMLPCEYCVQIRLDILVVFLGGMIAAAAPRAFPVKIAGWLLSFGGAAVGLKNSLVLDSITVKTLFVPDYFPVCRPGKVDFIFHLRLDKWLPTHFKPDGGCGEAPWFFLDLSMTQWLTVACSFMLASLVMVLAAGLMRETKNQPREASKREISHQEISRPEANPKD